MNRLNKTLLSFVLLFFCLLISVSYAEEFVIGNTYEYASVSSNASNNGSFLGTNAKTIIQTIENRFSSSNNETTEQLYNDLLSSWESNNYKYVIYKELNSGFINVLIFTKELDTNGIPYSDFGIGTTSPDITNAGTYIYYFGPTTSTSTTLGCRIYKDTNVSGIAVYGLQFNKNSSGGCCYTRSIDTSFGLITNTDIKQMSVTETSSRYGFPITWLGEYYYQVGGGEDTPSLPSNSEIASAVQTFYNTIYNQPNIAFDDFIVLYDVSTGLYSYIGHTRGNAIGQVIVEPNGYYNGYKFDVQWWQFFLDEQNDSWEWQNITKYNNYYLYTSQGDIDTLEFVGKDKIDNLFTSGPWATSNTIIVYSTNDYPVKYITFSDESPDPVVEEGTIRGDQYTYDENLDITDNQYNPLDNFVSIDYPSTLVSRAEFDKFMETFDENKDFLILPTDSNWIIIACNSLFNHFSSFIIMCAVFIIVERIMRG